MKAKFLNAGLFISSLFAYLEWGKAQSGFLFSIEIELFLKLFKDPLSVLHPFTILPLIGQLLLLITIFQKKVDRLKTWIGLACLSVLLLLILFIGIISLNYKIIFSSLPFVIIGIFTLKYHWKSQ